MTIILLNSLIEFNLINAKEPVYVSRRSRDPSPHRVLDDILLQLVYHGPHPVLVASFLDLVHPGPNNVLSPVEAKGVLLWDRHYVQRPGLAANHQPGLEEPYSLISYGGRVFDLVVP